MKKNRTKQTKKLTAGIRARCERRLRWGLAVSIMEEWAVPLTWGFIRRDSGAFCRRYARPLGLRRTPEAHLATALLVGTPPKHVRWEAATDEMEKKVHRSKVFTLLYPIADEGEARRGGWRKKDPTGVFLPSKWHCLSVAGGSSKGVLGSSDSADKTAEQTSTK